MTSTRRIMLAAAGGLAASAGDSGQVLAQAGSGEAAPAEKADFLFVQTARRMTYDRASRIMTLHDVSAVTVMFSDRPERIAGNMRTAAFVPFWSRGRDSFLADPPNADVSIQEGDGLRQVVVVLRDPALDGTNLRYGVEILEGEMPATGGETSVFIDVIGMPLTPLSFAGRRRRVYRRAFIR